MRQQINRSLSEISQKLNLSVPLTLMTARDSYATTLKRAGKSNDQIGEMLGHSNSIVTMHYLGSMDLDSTLEVNAPLF
jgi:DNA-binding CsgD family transcriptional regulator